MVNFDIILWSRRWEMNEIAFEMLEDDILFDSCQTCLKKKAVLHGIFVEEIRELIRFRGHGCVNFRNPANIENFNDWELHTHEDIMTILKLIDYGITSFHFISDPRTVIDVERNGVSIVTEVDEEK